VKISCKSVQKCLHKVANRQTNNDDYISSLAKIKKLHHLSTANMLTWHRSEDIRHENINEDVVECVVGLADIFLQRLDLSNDVHDFR